MYLLTTWAARNRGPLAIMELNAITLPVPKVPKNNMFELIVEKIFFLLFLSIPDLIPSVSLSLSFFLFNQYYFYLFPVADRS